MSSKQQIGVTLETLLRAAIAQHTEAGVIKMVQDAVRQKIAPLTPNQFFAGKGALRGIWERATNFGKSSDKECSSTAYAGHASSDPEKQLADRVRRLATLIRKMGLDFDLDTRCFPWNGLDRETVVAVVIGIRRVTIKEVSSNIKQRAVGARDMEAFVELCNLINSDFQTPCRIALHLVPADLPRNKTEEKFAQLRSQKEIGAIFVLGSPVTNKLCDSAAEAIVGRGISPRAKFRWSHRRPDSFLSLPDACTPDDEGVLTFDSKSFYPRVPDEKALRLYREGKRGPFADCGLLIIDCRVRPYLFVAAGHGGCGTKACIRALSDQEEIAKSLGDKDPWCFHVIRAFPEWKEDCDADTTSPTDSLDLPPGRNGWAFEYD